MWLRRISAAMDGRPVGQMDTMSILNRVRDAVALVRALGHTSIHGLIGHDYGAHVTAWAAQVRGDLFRRAVCMSAPFGGPPGIALRTDPTHADLLDLARPRKHYQWYYATRPAAGDMERAPQGLHAFLRAYFHMKSADWPENRPYALKRWDAENLAQMPTYYIMDADQDMAATVAPHMPSAAEIASCDWLSDRDLAVYTGEFGRSGLQGALNSYRCGTDPAFRRDLSVFHGQKIQIPMTFIAGQQDWGWAQVPGALEAMETRACADYRGTYLIEGAGHWVQQEQPELVADLVIQAMRDP